jgi:hypothetical protein
MKRDRFREILWNKIYYAGPGGLLIDDLSAGPASAKLSKQEIRDHVLDLILAGEVVTSPAGRLITRPRLRWYRLFQVDRKGNPIVQSQ